MDFEQMRLEVVETLKSRLKKTDGSPDKLTLALIELASKVSMEMLIKYHEALNESK